MTYQPTYIDGLAGEWVATPTPRADAPIVPYRRGRDGGMAYQAPPRRAVPVGGAVGNLDRALDAETYVTPSGTRAWRPTASEDALIDAVTANPYSGIDDLGRGGRGVARRLPYVGDVVGGAVEGARVYGQTGSPIHGAAAGAGSTVGGIGGAAIGGALGAVGGPAGVAAGGLIGGAVGGAVGSAVGQALADLISPLPPSNPNGAGTDTGIPPFTGGQSPGVRYFVRYQYNVVLTNGQLAEPPYIEESGGIGYPGPIINVFGVGTPTFQRLNIRFGANQEEQLKSGNCSQGCYRNVKLLSCRRADGKTDTGGNPPNIVDPYKPTAPVPIIPRVPGFPLPQPTAPGIRVRPGRPTEPPSSDPFGNPIGSPGPTGIGLPIGVPRPITGAPGGGITGAPGSYPGDGPHSDPYPAPTGDPTGPTDPSPGSGEDCDPCTELKKISDLLNETFSLSWALPPCGQAMTITTASTVEGKGLKGLSEQIKGLAEMVKVLHDQTRCESDPVVVIPDSWPIKAESNRPQLILLYADKKPDGTIGNRRYQFAIPHADGRLRKSLKAIVPKEIRKGSEQGTYVLKDNSKIITYCRDKTEAMRVLNAFDRLVLPGKKTDNKKTGGINPGTRFLEINVYPYEARYFSRGQAQLTPDWKEKLT